MLLRHAGFRRLCQARDRLAGAGERFVSIDEVARDARLSRSHFIRQFESVFGLTPHQFRIHARLEAAKRLLATGRYSVTDVCMEVGFSSLGSFSDLFRRRVGESPSTYQRRIRTLIQVPGRPFPGLAPGCLTLMAHLPVSAFRTFREASPARIARGRSTPRCSDSGRSTTSPWASSAG
jgi:AraC-like DNA-binding protein